MNEPIYEPSKTVERIKALRDTIGISAEFLNDKCKISKNTISKSADSPNGLSAKILYSIAEALDCSVDYLLGRTDKPKPEVEVIKDNHGSAFIGANVTELPVTIVQSENHQLDEMQKELLSRFGELPFTEKLAFMQELVKKTKNEIR